MVNPKRVATTAMAGATLAVKYGPQAKIAWDKGGKQAVARASRQAASISHKRKAIAHADSVVNGTILRCAPRGSTLYVVYSTDQPIATYPAQEEPLPELLAHIDLSRRMTPEQARRRPRDRRVSRPDPSAQQDEPPAIEDNRG